jgi:SAM-dependent methyltransferase
MPKDLSHSRPSTDIGAFYPLIHRQMLEQEGASGELRPSALEFARTVAEVSLAGRLALDAGCGGTLTLVAECASRGCRRVWALDLSEENVRSAGVIIEQKGYANIRLCRGSVLALPFGDASFDFVVCSGVAHHTPDPAAALNELSRVLKPGGRLYLSLYCFADSLFEGVVRLLRIVGGHVRFDAIHRAFGRSRIVNNFVLDHMYVPLLWLFDAREVREWLARERLSVLSERVSDMDPFHRAGPFGRWISGDGLMRIWICEKQ